MEFLGEFLERRALSSAACFVTYRRLPAYKKPNGGRSDPPPYNPRVSPVLVLHPQRYSALSTALSHPVSPTFSWNRGLQRGAMLGKVAGERDRITPLSVLTAKTRNWRTILIELEFCKQDLDIPATLPRGRTQSEYGKRRSLNITDKVPRLLLRGGSKCGELKGGKRGMDG
ncbi:Uncharacterized protein DBV15_00595 [Temnothorax longispinosus]|uniref:Uncharacterized protein n=1 Tax=Temnothorax longispinosus TaxID=300112 RepID=A0A4S2KSL8_9HYME|nr:Uncharacterized protein DBV15_00595 [Temnothorax longispinosus]